ncbi:MAG TPA: anthranilate synthase component I family protein [Candidatus Baltobacteraceae bacterium]|nr:anthranilate synthase component I family protein [Candidatus Baltobacteraceae bacterium]
MTSTASIGQIRTKRISLEEASPLCCYVAVREEYGEDECFLLESLSGPARDTASALVGFEKLLQIDMKGTALLVSGRGAWPEFITRILLTSHAEIVDGQLHVISGNTWNVLKTIHASFRADPESSLGFFSLFSYDAAWYNEKLPRETEDSAFALPDISLIFYRNVLVFDLANHTLTLEFATVENMPPPPIEKLRKSWNNKPDPVAPRDTPEPTKVVDSLTQEDFIDLSKKCLEHIFAGDIYQIQIGHEVTVTSQIHPFDVYLRLRKINPSPYMYYSPIHGSRIIGASPELFVRLEGDKVTMRPIAGTIKRVNDREQDRLSIKKLSEDSKERAEHLMLIDLNRNDIGRICVPGTLNVNERMLIESYSHVFHLVSNIEARVEPGLDIYDVIAAAFPAGTVTGTPKIRAMELIETFENRRRGHYGGAIGFISFNGDAVLGLCIRTTLWQNGTYALRASAGIVADSSPESEWDETLNKLAGTRLAICGEAR